jgi:hypothetical protein
MMKPRSVLNALSDLALRMMKTRRSAPIVQRDLVSMRRSWLLPLTLLFLSARASEAETATPRPKEADQASDRVWIEEMALVVDDEEVVAAVTTTLVTAALERKEPRPEAVSLMTQLRKPRQRNAQPGSPGTDPLDNTSAETRQNRLS